MPKTCRFMSYRNSWGALWAQLTLIGEQVRATGTSRGSEIPSGASTSEDLLRSPLAKRKKLAVDRMHTSKLKDSVVATPSRDVSDVGSPPATWEEDSQMGNAEDDADTEGEDFDFLADQLDEEEEQANDDEEPSS